ncbi:hypothetical protein [Vreelandella zhanjiangensis]|uniref:hypothetical protein n=1 Tax=Vreelandella zhanjiangensis TaxID=1121960 RepID=UPI00038052E8|nr:hypothetical protein [Halomonas zhanjiangensis]
MRLSHNSLWIPLSLLLVGCNNELATLTFDHHVIDNSNDTLIQAYHNELNALISEHGIDPEDIKITSSTRARRSIVLKVPFFGGPDDSLIASLKEHLQSIVDNKETALKVTFNLLPDKMSRISSEEREEIEALAQEYVVTLEIEEPVILTDYSLLDGANAVLSGSETVESHASCSMAMLVEPKLPFRQLTLGGETEEDFYQIFVRKLHVSNTSRGIPVDITTNNQILQEAFENDEVAMFINVRDEYVNPVRALYEGTDTRQLLEIDFGSIGAIRHEYGSVNQYSMSGLEKRCTNLAATYGRPFTYQYGESLDRLESVSFN